MADGRFAPSPTGALHVGNLRTALLAWLFARAGGGRFVLRMEDLDAATSRPEHAAGQQHDLAALGLDWDGDVVVQSHRRPAHDAALARLEAAGLTYPCFCTRREVLEAASAPNAAGPGPEGAYPGTCRHLSTAEQAARVGAGRRPALRLRAEGALVEVVDRLRGRVALAVDDVVLRRADGTPAYNLAVVVDDDAQGVDEVVRGDDLLTSTPRQALLADLLGLARPTWSHVPLVLGPDGRRLAKRHGDVTLADLTDLGVGPDEVRGRLATSLGLASPGERPALEVLLDRFDPAALPTEPWVLDGPPWVGTA